MCLKYGIQKLDRLPNLSHIESFYAVAKEGSIMAATSVGAGTRSTLSRHIASLESEMGVTLFKRVGDGLSLTLTGKELFKLAGDINLATKGWVTAALSQQNLVKGPVRIVASSGIASRILPQVISKLAALAPDIQIELVVASDKEKMAMRLADISIHTYPPTQMNLLTRKLGEIEFGAYASVDYLEKRGMPLNISDLESHDLVGEDQMTTFQDQLQTYGIDLSKKIVRFRCDNPEISWNLIISGCGIGVSQLRYGDADPRVKRIFSELPALNLPVWISSHSELKTSPRVRFTFDLIAKEFHKYL